MSEEEVVTIAVLGVTGAGKSTFVQRVTQDASIVIGHSLRAETRTTASYRLEHKGTRYEIVDCPGFNDTVRPDSEILEDIVAWLHRAHGEGRLLSGVIYLHRISDTRVQGTTMTQFQVLQALCGDAFYHNLVLGTTFWSRVSEEVGRNREVNLLEVKHFFGDMKDMGARYMRIPDDRDGCLAILEAISSNKRLQLQVQEERAEGKSFKGTAAFRTLEAAQAGSSTLHRWLSFLWLKLSGYLFLFLVILGNWVVYGLTEFLSWCKLGFQSARNQWDLHRRLQAEKARVRDQFASQESQLAPLQDAANALQRRLRQVRREESAAEKAQKQEAARRKAALAEEERRAKEQERKRRWFVAHEEWESQREEALRQFGIQASRKKMESRSGHVLTFVSCDQPGCGSGLWMDYYQKCRECSMRWCTSCRKQGRLVHTTSCSGSSEYGGLTREEALRECFQEAEPKLDSFEEPMTPVQAVVVVVVTVIVLVLFRHQLLSLARFLFYAPFALIRSTLAVFLYVLRGMAWVVSVVFQTAFYGVFYALGVVLGIGSVCLQAVLYAVSYALGVVLGIGSVCLQAIFYAVSYALGAVLGIGWLCLQAVYYVVCYALGLVLGVAWLVMQAVFYLFSGAISVVSFVISLAIWLLPMAFWAVWVVLLPVYIIFWT